MSKTDLNQVLEELKCKVVEHYGDNLSSLIVFGSVAKGLSTPESDIDLLVVLKKPQKGSYERYQEFLKIEDRLSSVKKLKAKGLNVHLSPMLKSVESLKPYLPWLWDTQFDILYDKDGFFKKFIAEIDKFKKRHLSFQEHPLPHYIVTEEW